MKTFLITISLLVAGVIIWISVSSPKIDTTKDSLKGETTVVSFENDIQIVDVVSKLGGYTPTVINAQAGKETNLRITSQNSYGCERAFRIPQLNVDEILPVDGQTTFELGSYEKGDEVFASCSMGMYTFKIIFE